MGLKEIILDGVKYIKSDSVVPQVQGDYVIVRCDRAGVFGGFLEADSEKGQSVTLKSARRLWYWAGAATLSQLAINGTSKPNDCKFPIEVPELRLKDVIELIPCTEVAMNSIRGVKVWEV